MALRRATWGSRSTQCTASPGLRWWTREPPAGRGAEVRVGERRHWRRRVHTPQRHRSRHGDRCGIMRHHQRRASLLAPATKLAWPTADEPLRPWHTRVIGCYSIAAALCSLHPLDAARPLQRPRPRPFRPRPLRPVPRAAAPTLLAGTSLSAGVARWLRCRHARWRSRSGFDGYLMEGKPSGVGVG